MRKKYKGGSSSRSSVAPVLSYPLADGATSQRDSSIIASSNMNAKQQTQIDQHGGRICPYCNKTISKRSTRRKKKSSKRRFKKFTRGGNSTNRITVPSFTTNTVSPTNTNSISVSTNSASLQSNANASGDCYATNSC
uniref:Uncharacterized protein n=1 Tax=viral metagenome TaxID=1070528 RepID=A0A6C0JWE6_9ZZZZ